MQNTKKILISAGIVLILIITNVITLYAISPSEIEKSKKIRLLNRDTIENLEKMITAFQEQVQELEQENASRREFECSINPECAK